MKFSNRQGSLARNLLRLALCMVVVPTGGLPPAVSGLPRDAETATGHTQASADLKTFIGIAVEGAFFFYPISVTNLGPDIAPNVTVTLPLPQGVTFASVSVGVFPSRPVRCTIPPGGSTGDVVCSLGDFRPNDRADIFINVNVVGAPGTRLATEARAASDATDPDPTNNRIKYETIIPPFPSFVSVRALANPFRLEIVGRIPFMADFGGFGFGIGCDCKDWPLVSSMGNTVILEGGRALKRQFPIGVPVQICYREPFRNILIKTTFTR
jgi:uncharacterized repeat protein (TIGR01451 family)